jgi:glutamyl-tRNA reductase
MLGLVDEPENNPVRKLAESSPSLFRDVRLLNIILPDNYQDMPKRDKTIHQSRIIMLAILARFFEKDEKDKARIVLTDMLKDHLGLQGEELEKFIDELGKSEGETATLDEIKKRIIYFLDTPVSLIKDLEKEIEFMKKFWYSA